jgi:hypothetical protein
MDIHYKIIEVNPNEHAIVVRYFTDFLSEEDLATNPEDPNRLPDGSPVRCRTDYNINVPVPAPTGAQLEEFIISNAPVHWLEIVRQVRDPDIDTSLSELQNMIGVHNTRSVEVAPSQPTYLAPFTPPAEPKEEIAGVMTDDDIKELLAKAAAGKAG